MRTFKPVEDTDVSDPAKYAKFVELCSRWDAMINSDTDEHAIYNQLVGLIDRDLCFWAIHFSRNYCSSGGADRQNDILHSFVNTGFRYQQAMAIRRLVEDKARYDSQAVVSLGTILDEMKAAHSVFTRENYLCSVNGHFHEDAPFRLFLHDSFDKLCGIRTSNLSIFNDRTQTVPKAFFQSLKDTMTTSKIVSKYTHKYIAHAADAFNRGNLFVGQKEFLKCYKELINVCEVLSGRVLHSSSHIYLPTRLYDHLDGLENPVCDASKIPELEAYWTKRKRRLERLERRAKGGRVL